MTLAVRLAGGCFGQSNPSAAARARRVFADQFDAGPFQGGDDLDQCVDDAANLAIGRFHALDRRQGQPGQLRELALVKSEKGTRCPHLLRRDHTSSMMFNTSKTSLNNRSEEHTSELQSLMRHSYADF